MNLASICLTGNPDIRVSNQHIINVVKLAKEHFYGLIIAEKCTALGLNEPVVDKNIIASIIDAGADILMAPTKGAVSGVRDDLTYHTIDYSHTRDTLVMSGIGTSQDNAAKNIIRKFAYNRKITRVGIQYFGDVGYNGLALIERNYKMSITLLHK